MENFYLEPNDELFLILDKLKKSQADDIVLVVPRGSSALRSIINIRILKEEAISLGKDISIVTNDTLIKKLVQQSGLRVLEKEPMTTDLQEDESWPEQLKQKGEIQVKKKRVMSDIIRPRKEEPEIEEEEVPTAVPTQVGTEVGKKEEEVVEPAQSPEGIEAGPPKFEDFGGEPEEKIKKARPSFKFFTKKRLIINGIIVCLVVLGLVFYFVLPRAQIIISPKKETVRLETEIIANKNIDSINFSQSNIPAQVFQLETEDSRKFPTTGEKDIEEKAQGIIIIYNQFSSSDQTLVKTTRFLSEEGKLFRLAETTVIPGATIEEGEIIPSTKEIEVIADEAGEGHNIGPSKFTIPGFEGSPKYTGFYGRSVEPMTGGAKGRMRVATQDDVEGALEIVSLELKNKVQEQFNKKIPKELKLLKETQVLEVIDSSLSLEADEPGKDFVVTVKVKAWGLAFKEEDVFELVEKNIGDKISENKILLPLTIKVNYLNTEVNLEQGRADFSCQVEAEAAWKIDKNQIKNDLAGKDEIEVRKYLSSLSEIERAKVIFWPFWVKKIPKNKEKINVIIDTEV